MQTLQKLAKGDKVAVLSPSFAAPGVWPDVYELGLERLRDVFGLEPVAFPTTSKVGASTEERAGDLVAAFEQKDIKAVIATLGGNDQVTYIKDIPSEPFTQNPKMFFGFSDNTHFANFLWQLGIPSYYGGCLFTQFAMQKEIDPFTLAYLKTAFFESGSKELRASDAYNDVVMDWGDPENLQKERICEPNNGWYWDGRGIAEGVSWGGCLESLDEMLRHDIALPSDGAFSDMVLLIETSEEIPPHEYVHRVLRAFGERGWLQRLKAVLVGRPQAYNLEKQLRVNERGIYRNEQRDVVVATIRAYNKTAPIVQNVDFGHTNPQIAIPYGMPIRVDADAQRIHAEF